MRAWGWPVERSPACSLQRQGRREALQAYARAPLVHLTSGASTAASAPRPVQLVWPGSHFEQRHQQRRHHAERTPQWAQQPYSGGEVQPASSRSLPPVELMARIKAARSWQELQSLVDNHTATMNHLHVSAVVTHMAQLHTSSSGEGGEGSGSSGGGDARQRVGGPGTLPDHTTNRLPLSRRSAQTAQFLGKVRHVPTARAPGKPPDAGPARQRQTPHLRQLRLAPLAQPLPASSNRAKPLPSRPQDLGAFLQQLQDAVTAHLPNFRARQLANTLWAFAKLGHKPPATWLAALLARMRAQLPAFEPQHLANTLYALMQLEYMPPSPWLVDFFAAVNTRLHAFMPAELAHLCYAAGKLRVTPGGKLLGGMFQHSSVNFQRYGLRELALLLYGLVHMGGELHADWMRMYRVRVAGLLVESGTVPRPLLEQWAPQLHPKSLAAAVNVQLRRQQPVHGQNGARPGGDPCPQRGLRAVDVLGADGTVYGPRAAVQAQATAAPHAVVVATSLATILASMAGWLYQPPQAFMEVVLGVMHGSVRQLDPAQLTGLLLTLAHLEYRPEPQLFQDVWECIMQSYDTLGRQHRTNALWAAARLRCAVPRSDGRMILRRAATELYNHTDAEVVALLAAAAGLRFKPRQEWLLLFESHLFQRLPTFQPFELVAVLQHLADLGHKPERLWMTQWATAAQTGMTSLGLPQLSAAAYAAARLGFRPPARLRAELLRAAAQRMGVVSSAEQDEVELDAPAGKQNWQSEHARVLDAQHEVVLGRGTQPCRTQRRRSHDDGVVRQRPEDLSRLLWSLAMLDVRPDAHWMAAYMACLQSSLGYCTAGELSLVVWALARLRHDPGPEWMTVFRQRASIPSAGDGVQESGPGLSAPLPRPEHVPVALHGGARSEQTNGRMEHAGVFGTLGTLAAAAPNTETSGLSLGGSLLSERGSFAARKLDFSRIILQGVTEWAECQLEAKGVPPTAATKHAVASAR